MLNKQLQRTVTRRRGVGTGSGVESVIDSQLSDDANHLERREADLLIEMLKEAVEYDEKT
jgi:hypothetical protein